MNQVLVWDAVSDRDDVEFGTVWQMLSEGRSILRPAHLIGSEPEPQISKVARERLADLSTRQNAGEPITDIDLKDAGSRFVPEELKSFPALTRLTLSGNQIKIVPGWTRELKGLQYLNLTNCGLESVPQPLGWLACLAGATPR